MATKKSSSKSGAKNKRSSGSSVGSLSMGKDKRVDVEQIENGFLVRESGTVGKGRNMQYKEKKYFSPTNPVQISKPTLKFGSKK